MTSQEAHHGLQQLLGTALVDNAVRAALLCDPLSLADSFELSMPERRFMARVRARDLEEFAALVESWITHQPVVQDRSLADRTDNIQLAG